MPESERLVVHTLDRYRNMGFLRKRPEELEADFASVSIASALGDADVCIVHALYCL